MPTKSLILTISLSFAVTSLLADEPVVPTDPYVVSGESERAAIPTDVIATKSDRIFYEVEPIAVSDDALMIRHRNGIVTIPADELSDGLRDLYAFGESTEVVEEPTEAVPVTSAPLFLTFPIQITLSVCTMPVYQVYPAIDYRTLRTRNAILATVPGRAAAVRHFLRTAGINQRY